MGQVRMPYEPPKLQVIGSVSALTLQYSGDKKFGPTDGFTLMGVAITNASP